MLLPVIVVLASSAACGQHPPTVLTPDQDRAFSEFNHHLAGWFLLLIGMLATLARADQRFAFLDKVWPLLFIVPGLYLVFMSDPDVWPLGAQSWSEAFRSNPEARQHKIYAVLLLALGWLELRRSRGRLGTVTAAWGFPALAIFGAVLLFFHEHGSGHAMTGMDGGSMMMNERMTRIKGEHAAFSIVGFGITLFKVLSDGRFWGRKFVPFLWPICMSILGVLLILYTE